MLESITKTLSRKPFVAATLATIGGVWVSLKVYNLATFTHLHFLRRSSLRRYKERTDSNSPGSWALVTGASDGIGKGFSEELCHRGFNVVLHGRNAKKLDDVRLDLLKQWPDREIKLFVFDATGEIADLEEAVPELKDLNLKILINNVGGGRRPFWIPLAENRTEEIRRPIEVDANFTTGITRLLLPQLTRQSPALVVNIGSLASEAPCPYASVVSGAKAYNKAWSRSLSLEMKAEGNDVEVMHILVGMVATANEGRTVSFGVPSPRQMASSILDKVGCGRDVVAGYWPHALQYFALTNLPLWVCEKIILSVAKGEKEKERGMLKAQ